MTDYIIIGALTIINLIAFLEIFRKLSIIERLILGKADCITNTNNTAQGLRVFPRDDKTEYEIQEARRNAELPK